MCIGEIASEHISRFESFELGRFLEVHIFLGWNSDPSKKESVFAWFVENRGTPKKPPPPKKKKKDREPPPQKKKRKKKRRSKFWGSVQIRLFQGRPREIRLGEVRAAQVGLRVAD